MAVIITTQAPTNPTAPANCGPPYTDVYIAISAPETPTWFNTPAHAATVVGRVGVRRHDRDSGGRRAGFGGGRGRGVSRGGARRVAPELVVVDSAIQEPGVEEEWQERILNDGTRWEVYKRYFMPEKLAAELGGGSTVFAGRWFVAVHS